MKLIEFFVGLTASFDLIKYLFRLGWIYRNVVSLSASHVPKSVLHTTNKEGQHLQSSVLILCDNKERLSDTCLKHESKCARQSEYLEKKGTKDKNRSLPPKLCSEMARYQRYVV